MRFMTHYIRTVHVHSAVRCTFTVVVVSVWSLCLLLNALSNKSTAHSFSPATLASWLVFVDFEIESTHIATFHVSDEVLRARWSTADLWELVSILVVTALAFRRMANMRTNIVLYAFPSLPR